MIKHSAKSNKLGKLHLNEAIIVQHYYISGCLSRTRLVRGPLEHSFPKTLSDNQGNRIMNCILMQTEKKVPESKLHNYIVYLIHNAK